MTLLGRSRLTPRIHAYAASFGEDFAREIIHDYAEKGSAVLDPFVGAGTTVAGISFVEPKCDRYRRRPHSL